MAIRQSNAVSGGKRRFDEGAARRGRQSQLTSIISNKNRAEELQRAEERNRISDDQWSRQQGLATRRFAFDQKQARDNRAASDRASEVGMGLSALQLGTGLGTKFGEKSFGQIGEDAKGLFSNSPAGTYSGGGFLGNLSVGSAFGGGLAGFGASKMLGKKKGKATKGLVGAGVGAALGLLGGGNSLGGALSGAFGGGLGGLFG